MSEWTLFGCACVFKKCFLPVGPALVADILVRAEAEAAAAKAVILRADLGPGGSSLV